MSINSGIYSRHKACLLTSLHAPCALQHFQSHCTHQPTLHIQHELLRLHMESKGPVLSNSFTHSFSPFSSCIKKQLCVRPQDMLKSAWNPKYSTVWCSTWIVCIYINLYLMNPVSMIKDSVQIPNGINIGRFHHLYEYQHKDIICKLKYEIHSNDFLIEISIFCFLHNLLSY